MKKIFFTILLFLIFGYNVFAFEKGRGFIQGSLNFAYAEVDGTGVDTTKDSSFSIGIGGGTFLSDDFSLSGLLLFSNTGNSGSTTTEIDLSLARMYSIKNNEVFYSPNVNFGYSQLSSDVSAVGLECNLLSFDYKLSESFVLSYVGGAYSFVYAFDNNNYLTTNSFSLNNHSIYAKYIF